MPSKPMGSGGSTAEGIKYYANLPVGTKGVLYPAKSMYFPTLVIFKDIRDPLSITKVNRENLEHFFGNGVNLKSITLVITDEPITWGRVDKYLPDNFNEKIMHNWRSLSRDDRVRLLPLVTFSQGEQE